MKNPIRPLLFGAILLSAGWIVASAVVFVGWRNAMVAQAAGTLDLQAAHLAASLELCGIRARHDCLPTASEIERLAPGTRAEILPDSFRLLPAGDRPGRFHLSHDGKERLVAEKPLPGGRILRLARALDSVRPSLASTLLGLASTLAGAVLPLLLLAGLLHRERQRTRHLVEAARAADLGLPPPAPPSGTSREESSLVASLGSEIRRRRILSRWEERRLARLLDSLSEGVLLLDGRLRILACNASAARALDLRQQKSSLRGRPIVSMVRDLGFLDDLRQAVSRGASTSFDVQRETSVFSTRVWPVPADADGSGWLVSLQDVTAQRNAERLQNRIVSDASHEFKTPLTSIRGWTETLLDDEEDEFRRKALERVVQGTRHMEEVVRDLLDLGRISETAGRDRREVALEEICSEAVATLEAEASRKGISIESTCPEGAAIRGYRGQLVRAVINLISNAVRYSPASGKVRLSVLPGEDGTWAIVVEDEGPGIPPEALPHLFERFYRVDHGRSRDLGGTGLGLAIVQETARTHGGRAEVESELGKGTRVRLVLADASGN